MIDPPILFVKPKAITARDKKALREAGVIVVEVDDPQSVKLCRAHGEISGGDLMMSALRALNSCSSDHLKARLVGELMKVLDVPTERTG